MQQLHLFIRGNMLPIDAQLFHGQLQGRSLTTASDFHPNAAERNFLFQAPELHSTCHIIDLLMNKGSCIVRNLDILCYQPGILIYNFLSNIFVHFTWTSILQQGFVE